MMRSSIKHVFAIIFAQTVAPLTYGQSQLENGQKLYMVNCVNCHLSSNSLGGPLTRLGSKYSDDWLSKWITNSSKLIYEKDKDAIHIFNQYSKITHPFFGFKATQMKDLITYIKTLR